MRKLIVFGLLAGLTAIPSVTATPAGAKVSGPNGRIVFTHFGPTESDSVTRTVNPDGSHVRRLFGRASNVPHWSPDGSQVSIFCCDDGMAAHIVDPDTGAFRELAPPDPTLETHCGMWSPDADQLACESFGVTDSGRNGIYSIRSSDGGGLTRITSNRGRDDIPGDYSPNGKRLVFVRADKDGPVGIFVAKLTGGKLRRITPPRMILDELFGGSWSPSGNKILFVARTAPDRGPAIWVVHANGRGLHQLRIKRPCGGRFSNPRSAACFDPGWSPDGTKIVFTRVTAKGKRANIYTVNADGSGLFRVTHTGRDAQPDWGPHPLTP
jgi:Tol biopolymer transport system component